MFKRTVTALMAAALLAPASARAQEGEEYQRGDLAQVTTWEVQPDQAEAWEGAMKKFVAAAEQANLGQEHGWWFWNDLYTYTLVFPVSSFAYFDAPQQWMQAFEGTAGKGLMEEAMAEAAAVDARVISDAIAEEVPAWGYQPAAEFDMATAKFAHVDVAWMKPGKDEQFAEAMEAWAELAKVIDYPYPYVTHRMHFGDGETLFVTFFDSKSDFYGAKSFDALVAAKGAGEQMMELLAKWNAAVARAQHYDIAARPELSYWPAEEMASN